MDSASANIKEKKFLIEVTSIKGRRTRIEMKDKSVFQVNNLSPNTKYEVQVSERDSQLQR